MQRYEYKVVPAPKKAGKIKGLRGTDAKFAASLAEIMNQFGADGWEYQRTDTLPCEVRQGLTGRTTTFQTMLVFRREINAVAETPETAQPVQITEAEPVPAVPTFRSTVPNAAPVYAGAPEGPAPKLGAARHPEPNDKTRAPDIAAQ